MNILQRDIEKLLAWAKNAGCVEEVRKLIDGAVWTCSGPALCRRIERFIRDHEDAVRAMDVGHREADVEPRKPFLPGQGSWGL